MEDVESSVRKPIAEEPSAQALLSALKMLPGDRIDAFMINLSMLSDQKGAEENGTGEDI